MKKITLFFAAIAFSAMSFAALNPFAYGLKSELSVDKSKVTVSYSLNADATSVKIVIMDGETAVKTVESDKLAKGVHSLEIPTTGLESNKDYTWKVEVTGASVEVPTQEETMYGFYCPHGLAIDKNPDSEYFGRIIVAEAMHGNKGTAPYVSHNEEGLQQAGLYTFNPDFTTDSVVYNGGLDLSRKLASVGYQPWRVKISEDGRIFVSSCDLNGVAVWEVSNDLETWTPLIAGTNNADDYNMYDANGEFFAGLNVSMDVKGSGEDLTLLLYSGNKKGISGYNASGFRLDEYLIGTATTFTGTPKNILQGGNFAVYHANAEFIYDGEGGYWFGASRANDQEVPLEQTNLAHVNADGVVDYTTWSPDFYGGDGVLVHNGMLFKGKKRTNSSTGNFGVYTIGKDEEGKTTLTEKWSVVANGIGRNLNEFAVDYAENLYIVGNSGEKIIAYALPYSGVVATPAAKKYVINLSASTFIENVEVINPAQKIIRNGQVLIIRDGKTYNMMGQEIR